MESDTFAAPADLRDVVAALWTGRWDLPADRPHATELISDPSVNIAFEAGPSGTESRVVGVWTRLWRRTLAGKGHVRAVKLRPGAVRAFIPVPAVDLVNRITPLHEIFGGATRRLEERILRADDETAFHIMTDWLRTVRCRDGATALAVSVVDRIVKDPSLTRMEDLARVSGYGPRALQRLFRDEVGASPTWVIRRYRLQEAALRIERGDPQSLAALAASLGYADQAHLARDFKRAVGKSPSAFAADVHR